MKKNFLKIISVILCLTMIMSASAVLGSAEGESERGEFDPFRITVTVNGDAKTQRGFCWYTSSSTDSVIKIFSAADMLPGTEVNVKIDYTDVFEWEGNYVHQAVVSGLNAGTRYFYTVGSSDVRSKVGTFTTDDNDSKVDFIAIADIQASSDENFAKGAATVRAAFNTLPTAEFLVNLGDFTNDSTNSEWDYHDKNMKDIHSATTLVPIAGNHDGLGVWDWFNNMFCLDTSESVQVKNGVNYSFDYGNAHFAVLNTNDLLSVSIAQLKWLENDMNSTDKDWKIVFMHKSPYTLGKDGKWPDALYLQKSLTKVLAKCDVDLVMSGHDHQYLRTKPLKNNKIDSDGTTYVLSGTAGTKRYEVRPFLAEHFLDTDFIAALTIQKRGWGNYWNGSDWEQTKQSNIGGCFNCISIDGGTLTLKSYILADKENENDADVITLHDEVVFTKQTGMNKITFTGDNTTSEFEYYLGVVPSFLKLAAYAFGEWLPKVIIMLPDLLDSVINEDIF